MRKNWLSLLFLTVLLGIPLVAWLVAHQSSLCQLTLESDTSWAVMSEAGFTGLLVLVSALLALYTYRLWSSTEITTKKQLRAFIGVNDGDRTVKFYTSGSMHIPEVLLHITNYGKSIANNVRVFHRVILLNHPTPQQIDFDQDLLASPGHASIFPSQDHVISCHPNAPGGFGQAQVQQFLAPMGTGSLRLMVYGHITYNDGFDDRKTNFAYTIIWRELNAPTSGEKPGFYFHNEHNDAT